MVLHPHPHTPSIHASFPPVVPHHLKRHGAFDYRCPDIAYPHLVFHEALGYGHRVGTADRCCLRVGGAKGHKQEGACFRGGVVLGYIALAYSYAGRRDNASYTHTRNALTTMSRTKLNTMIQGKVTSIGSRTPRSSHTLLTLRPYLCPRFGLLCLLLAGRPQLGRELEFVARLVERL